MTAKIILIVKIVQTEIITYCDIFFNIYVFQLENVTNTISH